MKLFKYILCLFCAISLTACHQDEKQDFWKATIDAVQSKSKDNAYLKNNWNIGISSDEGKKHQNMAARYIVENDNETTTTIFALQNQNDKEYISYTYTTDVIEDTKEYQKTITINSTNKKYTKYDIQYNYYEFENGNYTYGEDATGSISINKDGITYDNVPLLNEAIQSCCTIIDDFQEEFDIDYEEYDFDPLPYQMKDLNIPSIDKIQEETATSTDYYGEQRINAKGYTLVDCLSIDKDTNEATYSTFNYERQSDEESIPCTLSLQGNNIYLLTPDMDIDFTYYIYKTDETVCLLSREKVDGYVNVDLDTDKIVSKSKTGTATYKEIKEYINDKYGFTVSSLNIAQIKDKCGLDKRKNYNKGAEGHKVPACPEKKEKAILDAFEHFGLV